jgi:N-acyl-D-aspartate/D-glutamate deacylase
MRQDVGAYAGAGGGAAAAADWSKMRVVEGRHPRKYPYEGKAISELAARTGKPPMDAMLDLALDEALRTESPFPPSAGPDTKAVAEIVHHPFTHPCVSDGGSTHATRPCAPGRSISWRRVCETSVS